MSVIEVGMTFNHGTIIKGYFEKDQGLEPRVYTQSASFKLGVYPKDLKSGQPILVRARESAYVDVMSVRFISQEVPENFPVEGIEQGRYVLYATWPNTIVPTLNEVLDEYNPGDTTAVQFFLKEGCISRSKQSSTKRGIMFGRNKISKGGNASKRCHFQKTITRAGKETEYTTLILCSEELESMINELAQTREYVSIRMSPLKGNFRSSANEVNL